MDKKGFQISSDGNDRFKTTYLIAYDNPKWNESSNKKQSTEYNTERQENRDRCMICNNSNIYPYAISKTASNDQAYYNYNPRENTNNLKEYNRNNGTCGLENLGNTCFINSSLQCLSNIRVIRDFYIQNTEFKDSFSADFSRVIRNLWKTNKASYSPDQLIENVQSFIPQYRRGRQYDCQEFLSIILNKLNENSRSIIEKTFEGAFQKIFSCKKCRSTTNSKKQDKFYILNLPTTPNENRKDLTQCLEKFTNETSIDWDCTKCGDDRPSLLKVLITKLPKILIFRVKNSVEQAFLVNYESIIDMRKYCYPDTESTSYSLIGVINHFGSHLGGHYTAFAKNPDDNRWYEFNDLIVREISPNSVINASSSAYILFYERR